MDALAERVKAALESSDPSRFADLLDPNVRWGAPDNPKPPCRNRDQVLRWCERGRAQGRRAHVVSVEAHGDKVLIELRVFNLSDAAVEQARWQVMTCQDGLVVDIRGFESQEEALARLGV